MTPKQYRSLLAAGRCLACETTRPTHGSSGGQRQCPDCRRKWTFTGLRAEVDLLAAFARGTPARTTAARMGVSLARVLRHYTRFRAAIPAVHAERARRSLVESAGMILPDAAKRVAAVLDDQPERVRGVGADRLTAAIVVGQAVVFLAADEVDRFSADVARLGGQVDAVVAVAAVANEGLCDWMSPFDLPIAVVRHRRRVPVRNVPAHLCEVVERDWSGPAGIERLVLDRVILPAVRGRAGRPTRGEQPD